MERTRRMVVKEAAFHGVLWEAAVSMSCQRGGALASLAHCQQPHGRSIRPKRLTLLAGLLGEAGTWMERDGCRGEICM